MVEKINKQQTGFKFGTNRLTVEKELGEIQYQGRKYKLVRVRTSDNLIYHSLRLYNGNGKFIKQLLFEPEIQRALSMLLFKDS